MPATIPGGRTRRVLPAATSSASKSSRDNTLGEDLGWLLRVQSHPENNFRAGTGGQTEREASAVDGGDPSVDLCGLDPMLAVGAALNDDCSRRRLIQIDECDYRAI